MDDCCKKLEKSVLLEKRAPTTGSPLLDHVVDVVEEYQHSKRLRDTLAAMYGSANKATEIELHFGLAITGPKRTAEDIEAEMRRRPEVRDLLDGPNGAAAEKQLKQYIDHKAGVAIADTEHLSFSLPISKSTTKQMLDIIAANCPEVDSSKVAQALRKMADDVESKS
jgi:hypothetical protein